MTTNKNNQQPNKINNKKIKFHKKNLSGKKMMKLSNQKGLYKKLEFKIYYCTKHRLLVFNKRTKQKIYLNKSNKKKKKKIIIIPIKKI